MRLSVIALLLSAVGLFGCYAQDQVNLSAPPPPPITNFSGSPTGSQTGGQTLYYWIVVRYPIGAVGPTGPFQVNNTVGRQNINGTNFVLLNWVGTTGATGYDVLSSVDPINPAQTGACNACRVVTNTASTQFTDNSNALGTYTVPASASPATATMQLNNRDFSTPQITFNPPTILSTISANTTINVNTLPTAATAVRDAVYKWARGFPNQCPLNGAGGSGGTTVVYCVTHDNATWQAMLQTDGSGNVGGPSTTRAIGCGVGDPAGSALATGVLCYVVAPIGCTIQSWDILVDSGTATVGIWKVATGAALPTVTNSIVASAAPAISTGTSIHSTTMTSWTISVAKYDIFGFNLTTTSGPKYVYVDVMCDGSN